MDRKSLVVTRILGARHLVQAAFSGINPNPEVLAAGIWVDTVHSMTAFGLAAVDRRRPAGVWSTGSSPGCGRGWLCVT
ncbi:MAG: hypothetical protein QOC58_1765 [Mycobacterium sp.]|nr:hypothetical protein [Mycobacterium sp.]